MGFARLANRGSRTPAAGQPDFNYHDSNTPEWQQIQQRASSPLHTPPYDTAHPRAQPSGLGQPTSLPLSQANLMRQNDLSQQNGKPGGSPKYGHPPNGKADEYNMLRSYYFKDEAPPTYRSELSSARSSTSSIGRRRTRSNVTMLEAQQEEGGQDDPQLLKAQYSNSHPKADPLYSRSLSPAQNQALPPNELHSHPPGNSYSLMPTYSAMYKSNSGIREHGSPYITYDKYDVQMQNSQQPPYSHETQRHLHRAISSSAVGKLSSAAVIPATAPRHKLQGKLSSQGSSYYGIQSTPEERGDVRLYQVPLQGSIVAMRAEVPEQQWPLGKGSSGSGFDYGPKKGTEQGGAYGFDGKEGLLKQSKSIGREDDDDVARDKYAAGLAATRNSALLRQLMEAEKEYQELGQKIEDLYEQGGKRAGEQKDKKHHSQQQQDVAKRQQAFIKNLEDQKSLLDKELHRRRDEHKKIHSKLEELGEKAQSKNQDLHQLYNQCKSLQSDLHAKEKEIQTLSSAADRLSQEVDEKNEEIALLQDRVKDTELAIKHREDDLKKLHQEKEDMHHRLKQMDKNKGPQDGRGKAEKKLRQRQESVTKLQSQLAELDRRLAQKQDLVEAQRQQTEEARQLLNQRSVEVDENGAVLQDMQSSIEDMEQQAHELSREVQVKEKKAKEQEQLLQRAGVDLQDIQHQLVGMEEEQSRQRGEYKGLQEQEAYARRQLEQVHARDQNADKRQREVQQALREHQPADHRRVKPSRSSRR